jgi:hypothetical protein
MVTDVMSLLQQQLKVELKYNDKINMKIVKIRQMNNARKYRIKVTMVLIGK